MSATISQHAIDFSNGVTLARHAYREAMSAQRIAYEIRALANDDDARAKSVTAGFEHEYLMVKAVPA